MTPRTRGSDQSMTDALTATEAPARKLRDADGAFRSLELALYAVGPAAALDRLIEQLDASRQYRALLDALLLKARHDLGLPSIMPGSLASLPEPARTQYEEQYVSRDPAGRVPASRWPATFRPPGPTTARSPKPSRSPVPYASTDRRRMMSDWARSSRSPSIKASARARIRADPGTLRHLPGDHRVRAVAARTRKRLDPRAQAA